MPGTDKTSESRGTGTSSRRRPGTKASAGSGLRFVVYVLRRYFADAGTQRAAALTYTSLLALVPLLAISFAIFAAFPAFDEVKATAQNFIFQNFVPQVGTTVQRYLESFANQAGRMTAVGVVFLVVTSVMLLAAVSETFNAIWRVRDTRGPLGRLLAFWAALTLMPLLFGASLSLSSYLFAAARASGVEAYTGPLTRLAGFVPLILQIIGFTFLFRIIPHYPVRRRDAMIGGIATGLLFEILKKGFGLYVSSFANYQAIYGALAAFPIFLIWIYLCWTVVLIGAEITAALPEWRAGMRTTGSGAPPGPAARLTAALGVLYALMLASRRGESVSRRHLLQTVAVEPAAVEDVTEQLVKARYIAKTERGEWILARDLDTVTLSDLYAELGLRLALPDRLRVEETSWGRRFVEIVERLGDADREVMKLPLKELLTPPPGAEIIDFAEHVEDCAADNEQIASRKSKVLALLGLTWLGSS